MGSVLNCVKAKTMAAQREEMSDNWDQWRERIAMAFVTWMFWKCTLEGDFDSLNE